MILMRITGSQVSSVRFKGFWGRGMTGTKVPLKITPNHRTTSVRKASVVLPTDLPATHKPKLLDQLRKALHLRHYSGRTEQTDMDLHSCAQPRADRCKQFRRRVLTGSGEFYTDPHETP
jgi:hypothetical protein